ncbi:hypothetical protein B0T18DRAFT_390394 [Schizothecium vesticola]|uniref:Cyanovirin-N domain-containing protein n=1 Tax=Schizothecium vesticola TaxID=314040 RepID=A0AA40EUL0_9PEZI|nr:hypothetical protein B0T18DRAFT_390394 [Schizothecium vesticola]
MQSHSNATPILFAALWGGNGINHWLVHLDLALFVKNKKGQLVFKRLHQSILLSACCFDLSAQTLELKALCLSKHGKFDLASIQLNNHYANDHGCFVSNRSGNHLAGIGHNFRLKLSEKALELLAKLPNRNHVFGPASVDLSIDVVNRDGKLVFEEHSGILDRDGWLADFLEPLPIIGLVGSLKRRRWGVTVPLLVVWLMIFVMLWCRIFCRASPRPSGMTRSARRQVIEPKLRSKRKADRRELEQLGPKNEELEKKLGLEQSEETLSQNSETYWKNRAQTAERHTCDHSSCTSNAESWRSQYNSCSANLGRTLASVRNARGNAWGTSDANEMWIQGIAPEMIVNREMVVSILDEISRKLAHYNWPVI